MHFTYVELHIFFEELSCHCKVSHPTQLFFIYSMNNKWWLIEWQLSEVFQHQFKKFQGFGGTTPKSTLRSTKVKSREASSNCCLLKREFCLFTHESSYYKDCSPAPPEMTLLDILTCESTSHRVNVLTLISRKYQLWACLHPRPCKAKQK